MFWLPLPSILIANVMGRCNCLTSPPFRERNGALNRRVMILFIGAIMAVGILATAGMAWAQADPPLNETPDDTWMTNGVVNSVIRSGDFIYVGGKFTKVRSAVTGGQSFAATNLARFDAD